MGALASYGAWNYGMASAASLPRPADVFMSGAFSPLNPIMPVGIDQPDPESGRPSPRRMQYPVGWNMPVGQPGTEGLKLVSFGNLRAYADAYSVVRACIQVRKEEILGLDWDIVPTDEAQRDMRGDAQAHQDFQERRQKAVAFFKRPDPNYHDFTGWMGAVLEDVLVVDALSIYLHPARVAGKGLLGSDLAALEVLDGTTIRPLLDIRGGTPRPPSPAYQQYLWGVPRTDLMDIILQADIDEMDEPVAEYKADQLMYLPYTRRSWTPYGFPGIERAIIPVMTGLKRQQFQLEFFSEGTIPGQFVTPGDDISTPAQIRQLQDTLNAIAGDQAWKHKIIVLPRGSKTMPQKPLDLASDFDAQLVTAICMAYDVMPMELGITPGGGGGQTPQATNQMAQASEEINKRKALKPMLQWLKSAIFDHVLQDICDQEDMQWAWVGLESIDDEEQKASNFKTLTGIGLLSIDEARVQMGLSPWGLPLTSDPVYMSATGVSTLGTVDPATAETYFDQTPIVSPSTLSSQPQGQPVGSTSTAGQTAPPPSTPNASAGLPAAGGRPAGGGGGAPTVQSPRSGAGSTPLHEGGKAKQQAKAVQKAMLSEFDALRRHLKKGRSADAWKNEYIDDDALQAIKDSIAQGASHVVAIDVGKSVVKSAARLENRRDTLQSHANEVIATLGALAATINHPQVGLVQFIDQGTQVLADGYHSVMQTAAQHAANDYDNVSSVVPGGFAIFASQRAERQRGFLTGLAQDVLSGASEAKLNQRLALYARSLLPAYEQAYGLTVTSGQAIGNGVKTSKIAKAKPIMSGGDPLSEADQAAQDALDAQEAQQAAQEEAAQAAEDAIALAPEQSDAESQPDPASAGGEGINGVDALVAAVGLVALDVLTNDVQDPSGDMSGGDAPTDFATAPPTNIIWHTTGGEGSCDLCAERDGETYTMDTLPCWPGDGGFGEFCDGAGNCNCYLEYVEDNQSDNATASNPISDYTNTFYAQRAAEETALDQQATDARAADIAAVAEESPDAAARMSQRDALYGTPGTRYGPGGNYDPMGSGAQDAGSNASITDATTIDAAGASDQAPGDVTASAEPEITKSDANVEKSVYKALDPETFHSISLDDIVVNPLDEDFDDEQPNDAEFIAVIKGVTSSLIAADTELVVTNITLNEVEFHILY